jgi:uncharacterized protein YggE
MAVVLFFGIGAETSAANDKQDRVPRLTVPGKALLSVPADQVQLNIGVVTTGATADASLQLNTETMRKVEAAVKTAGLTPDEYHTGQFQIRPDWAPRPRNAGEDWKPGIIAYTVTNSLKVKTRKIAVAGRLIGACAEAGANDIGSLIFDLADPRSFRSRAIELAVVNARADASALAKAASVRLVRILSISLDEAVEQPLRINRPEYARASVAMADAAPDISPGEVTVRASVLVVFEISPETPGASSSGS